MSWMQKLFETYEATIERHGVSTGGPPLLPVGHTLQQAHVDIVLDQLGNFRRADVSGGVETIIPATESSAGRTTNESPHPLCDKIQYVAGDYGCDGYGGTKKSYFASYYDLLKRWFAEEPHPKLRAVLTYVSKKRVVADLVAAGILYLDPVTKMLANACPDGPPRPAIFGVIPKDAKKKVAGKPLQDQGSAFVRWRVEVPGNVASGTWEDADLLASWTAYSTRDSDSKGVCLVTGRMDVPIARMHPKRLRHGGDGARLISSNDDKGYTFLGRFSTADDAATVAADVTQKAHSALRWLIARQAYRHATQVVVAWAPSGKPMPDPLASSESLFAESDAELVTLDAADTHLSTGVGDVGQAFSRRLAKMIAGYKADLGATEAIIVMGLDSATPGRLAVTFYRELTGSEFLDRVTNWHANHAWPRVAAEMRFVGAPSPREIAEAAYGSRIDDKLARATVERILPCIIDGRPLPRDLMEAAVRRAAKRASTEALEWEQVLWIACALFRGYHKERSYGMALETDMRTRDYLYGRLLAIAEHIEARALYVAGEKRDTTAAKLMQRFADRPYSTWLTIEKSLVPYKTRLQSKRPGFLSWTTGLMDEVHGLFPSVQEYADNRPLTGEYLLGYHCQRGVLRQGAVGIAGEESQDDSEE